MITQCQIIGFKGIENKSYQMSEKTNFYGKNATGKTSIFDAIQVAFFGPGNKRNVFNHSWRDPFLHQSLGKKTG